MSQSMHSELTRQNHNDRGAPRSSAAVITAVVCLPYHIHSAWCKRKQTKKQTQKKDKPAGRSLRIMIFRLKWNLEGWAEEQEAI